MTRLCACLLAVACSDQADPREGPPVTGQPGPGGSPPKPGPGMVPTGMSPAPPPAGTPADPGPATLRRLTNVQYANTVRAVLGLANSNVEALLGHDRSLEAFANGPHQAAPSTGVSQTYAGAAASLAEAATAPAVRSGLFDAAACGDRTACLTSFVKTFGRRLFRRPLVEEELTAVTSRAVEEARLADDFWPGARYALEVMLQSVPFLYVVDTGSKDPARPDLLRRDPHALATRLALLLWNSGPDDQLLDIADRNGLRSTAEIGAQVTRMMGDRRAQESARLFFREWLGYDLVTRATKDASHVDFKPALVQALVAETDRLVDHFLGGNKPVMDLFRADFTFADDAVKGFYGATMTDGNAVKLPAARRGILGHASFIAANSGPGNQSPTLRGLGVVNRFLCGEIPDPPATAPAELPESADKVPRTIRERTELYMLSNDSCNGCHKFMDRTGFLFEQFDAIGKFRTVEAVAGAPGGTKPVDATGSLLTLGMDRVEGLPGLATVLATDATAQRCFLRHLLQWGLGRDHLPSDAATLETLGDAYAKGGGAFRAVMTAMATSDALVYMRPAN